MQKVAQFFKVSKDIFVNDTTDLAYDTRLSAYENIALPKRATAGSAGYDFYVPYDIEIAPKETTIISTGIRVKIDEGYMLALFPRSGLGFRYRMQLNNTVGIIDSDYYFSDNEGHIMAKVYNGSADESIILAAGTAFMQGVFMPFGITVDDDASGARNGGFGSTDK